jgi:hypothetical protein
MRSCLSKSWLTTLLVVVLAFQGTSVKAVTDDDLTVKKFWGYLRGKYDALPEKGKFATGAALGFGGSRLAVNSAVGVVKLGGAVFIA